MIGIGVGWLVLAVIEVRTGLGDLLVLADSSFAQIIMLFELRKKNTRRSSAVKPRWWVFTVSQRVFLFLDVLANLLSSQGVDLRLLRGIDRVDSRALRQWIPDGCRRESRRNLGFARRALILSSSGDRYR